MIDSDAISCLGKPLAVRSAIQQLYLGRVGMGTGGTYVKFSLFLDVVASGILLILMLMLALDIGGWWWWFSRCSWWLSSWMVGCHSKRHDRLSMSFVEIGYHSPNLSNQLGLVSKCILCSNFQASRKRQRPLTKKEIILTNQKLSLMIHMFDRWERLLLWLWHLGEVVWGWYQTYYVFTSVAFVRYSPRSDIKYIRSRL